MNRILMISAAILLILVSMALAADNITDLEATYSKKETIDAATGTASATEASALDKLKHEFHMASLKNRLSQCIILSFLALLSLMLVAWLVNRYPQSSKEIRHTSGLVLLIFGTILLVVVVDTDAQLTASMGIFGAIAGYLFGQNKSSQDTPPPPGGPTGTTTGAGQNPAPGGKPAP